MEINIDYISQAQLVRLQNKLDSLYQERDRVTTPDWLRSVDEDITYISGKITELKRILNQL